jgi:predicted SAM-dependent methyltransferase
MDRRITIGTKIDLGCGSAKKEGFIGIDKIDFGQEILWDVANGIPLPDKSVDEIYSAQFLEHLTEPQLNIVIWDIVRIAKEGAKILIIVPNAEYPEAFDIAHSSFWTEQKALGLFRSCGLNPIVETRDNNLYINITK